MSDRPTEPIPNGHAEGTSGVPADRPRRPRRPPPGKAARTVPVLGLSVREAATAIGVSATTMRMLIRTGAVPAVTVGTRMIRVPLDGLRRALNSTDI
jgi:excisionase family DNA binding protein